MDDRALAKLAKSRIRNSNLRQRSAKEDQRASSMGRRPLVGLEVAYRRAQRGQTEEKQNKMDVQAAQRISVDANTKKWIPKER